MLVYSIESNVFIIRPGYIVPRTVPNDLFVGDTVEFFRERGCFTFDPLTYGIGAGREENGLVSSVN